MKYNLRSPSGLRFPCNPTHLDKWTDLELRAIESVPLRNVVKSVIRNLDEFVCWPRHAILLWRGCDRVPLPGEKRKYHSFPDCIRKLAQEHDVALDRRANGPAVVAFHVAGGDRPSRWGSANGWSIHHLYSGKFPYIGKSDTLHAVKNGQHFTQSAGLVAVHPIADALCDELPFFAWRLRAEAFRLFGYDPDGAFGGRRNPYGFSAGYNCTVVFGTN